MRIRKRLAPSSAPTSALLDLHPRQSEAAAPPSRQSMPTPTTTNDKWVFPKNDKTEEKMKQKIGDDEIWIMEAQKSNNNNDIRKIVKICECDGEEGAYKPLELSSTHEDYKDAPLKKRRGSFERDGNEETTLLSAEMKSKTNKKRGNSIVKLDQDQGIVINGGHDSSSNSKRGAVIMEGSRCSRVNGRGWRCCQPTLVGYSLCEHHLGKGRLRSVANDRRSVVVVRGGDAELSGGDSTEQLQPLMVRKKRTKIGVMKARSMSSLLGQI